MPDIRGIHISGCTFRNNTSDPQESGNLISTSALLQDLLFPGRGGAIAITINSTFAYNASIEDCVIENNHATSFGGGIYLGYSVYAPHATSVNRTMFVSNHCDGPSGGLQLGFVEGGVNGVLRLDIYNSEFYDNHALFGGAIQVLSNGEYPNHNRMCVHGLRIVMHHQDNVCTVKAWVNVHVKAVNHIQFASGSLCTWPT